MPFKRILFKKNKAYVKVDAAGKPVVTEGRVEICYKPNDTRVYKASVANIKEMAEPQPLIDEADLPEKKPAEPKKKTGAKSKGSAADYDKPVDDPNAIDAWTDGACSGNPGDAGSGIVLLSGEHRREVSRYLGTATNNIAELFAIKVALELIKTKSRPVRIFTDSAYSLGVLTKGWKAKKNPELVAEIRDLLATFKQVQFIKVKGHAEIPENERADELARMAISNSTDSDVRV